MPRLMALAREEGTFAPHLAMFEAMGRVASDVLGTSLPLNGAGCCGAALADIGIPQQLLRGVVLLARAAGLLGHRRGAPQSDRLRHLRRRRGQRALCRYERVTIGDQPMIVAVA